jgi:hypothetical protein
MCIAGYICIYVAVKKPAGQRGRYSGGVCIVCKDTLITGVRVLEQNVNGVIWITLDKTFFNTDADTYMCVLYILPPGSPTIVRDYLDFFEILEDGIAKYENLRNVVICGDLNSRVGCLDDMLKTNDLRYCVDICDDNPFIDINCDIPTRSSEENVVNTYGRRLLNVCKSTGLVIGNGRLGKDSGNW